MVRRPRAALALLVALVLTTASPAAIHAADAATPDAATPDVSIAAATPLDTNLLRNRGVRGHVHRRVDPRVDGRGRRARGAVRVPTLALPGLRAEVRRWSRYLGCNGSSGLVRQSVPFTGWDDRSFWLKAHLQADFGGRIGHAIRVTIRATGPGIDRVKHELKPLTITNSYKRAVAWLLIPPGTDRITATVELVGASRAARGAGWSPTPSS